MGKQSRRKQRGSKKNNEVQRKSPTANPETNGAGSTTFINRIRHGDVRVRHGALTGLSTTIFSPEALCSARTISNGVNDKVKIELIRAVTERIMDTDVPIATCAVGCLVNYTLFGLRPEDSQQVSDIVYPVILTRIQNTIDFIYQMHQELKHSVKSTVDPMSVSHKNTVASSSHYEKGVLQIMELWSLVSLSLNVLCTLVELCDSEYCSLLSNLNESKDYMNIFFRVLSLGTEIISYRQTDDNPMSLGQPDKIKSLIQCEQENNVIGKCLCFAARTLHSSLDENPILLGTLIQNEYFMNMLVTTLQNSYLPAMARLHCAGALVATHLILNNSQKSQTIEKLIRSFVIPLLKHYIVFNMDIANVMISQITSVKKSLQEEEMDEVMENEVIRLTRDRNESARSIARRHNVLKAENDGIDSDLNGKEIENDELAVKGSTGERKSLRFDDGENLESAERYEKATSAWKDACQPLILALEITANLCTSQSKVHPDDMSMNEDQFLEDMSWDPEREKRLLLEMNKNNVTNHETDVTVNDAFIADIIEYRIPDDIVTTFGGAFLCFKNILAVSSCYLPQEVIVELENILSKGGHCLTNVLLMASLWICDNSEAAVMWKHFCQALAEILDPKIISSVHQRKVASTITHVLSSLLRSRPSVIPEIDEIELLLIVSCLTSESRGEKLTKDNDNGEYSSVVVDLQKDSISILGQIGGLCHSDTLKERVTVILLSCLNNLDDVDITVVAEVLNVLMDIYGTDERDSVHQKNVFEACGVLNTFRKSIPFLKRKIDHERRLSDSNKNLYELEYWKETLLNARRFVQYKTV